jgi:hypothetical protein
MKVKLIQKVSDKYQEEMVVEVGNALAAHWLEEGYAVVYEAVKVVVVEPVAELPVEYVKPVKKLKK